jgi:serine/threonine protein kinase
MNQATFLHHLYRSRLLSRDQFQEVAGRLAQGQAADLARALVAEGLLTGYQAEQLLAGKSRGFVLGRYRILDYLGRGATAFVFKGADPATGREVALKVINPEVFDSDALDSLRREIETARRLRHPNIVAAYETGKSGKAHFLVLEFVDGLNLRRVVRKGGPLPLALACEVVRQMAQALDYAHARGVVHRDLKPANVLIRGLPGWTRNGPPPYGWFPLASAGPGPEVKILDFGMARLRQAAADLPFLKAGDVYGTPDFLAPEQAWDIHAADIRSDLYSLGCTLYYALAGKVPFSGSTALEKLLKHQLEEPVPVEQRRSDVLPVLAALVRRLMAKDPAARFQTPAEVAEALRPWGRRPGTPISMTQTFAHAHLNTAGGGSAEAGAGWVLENLSSGAAGAHPSEKDAHSPGEDRRLPRPRGK